VLEQLEHLQLLELQLEELERLEQQLPQRLERHRLVQLEQHRLAHRLLEHKLVQLERHKLEQPGHRLERKLVQLEQHKLERPGHRLEHKLVRLEQHKLEQPGHRLVHKLERLEHSSLELVHSRRCDEPSSRELSSREPCGRKDQRCSSSEPVRSKLEQPEQHSWRGDQPERNLQQLPTQQLPSDNKRPSSTSQILLYQKSSREPKCFETLQTTLGGCLFHLAMFGSRAGAFAATDPDHRTPPEKGGLTPSIHSRINRSR